MRRMIDPDQIRERFDFKVFRHVPLFLLGVLSSRLVGYLYYIPGMWIVAVGLWGVWVCFAAPLAFAIYMNLRQFRDWDEGIDPNMMVIVPLAAVVMLLGTALEVYRVGG